MSNFFTLLLAREARLLCRRPAELANPLVFFAIVIALFPLAVGPESQLLQTLSEFLRQDARVRSELEARQSWTVNAARLAVAAPWVVLLLIGTQPVAVETYRTAAGAAVLLAGLVVSVVCYQLMLRIGSLPQDERVIA